jgi:hypothetical protein
MSYAKRRVVGGALQELLDGVELLGEERLPVPAQGQQITILEAQTTILTMTLPRLENELAPGSDFGVGWFGWGLVCE